jgi:ATP-binding cassette subfamily G (WHITE) protein 2 (SNQ2)
VTEDEQAAVTSDEEKAQSARGPEDRAAHEAEDVIATQPMEDTFSWQHLRYTVPVSGGERQLLDDISGYVVPGKLTALMGESGAGKVRSACYPHASG